MNVHGPPLKTNIRRTPPGRLLGWLTLLALLAVPWQAPAQSPVSETDIRAAYLYNFAKFTRWPEQVFADADVPIRICVMGSAPIAGALEDLLAGKQIDQRDIKAVAVRNAGPQLRNCQLIYHHPDAGTGAWELLRIVQDFPVVTVGEGSGFLDLGGVIGFVTLENKVRFELSLPAARRAGVMLSSRLMKVAGQVRREGVVP